VTWIQKQHQPACNEGGNQSDLDSEAASERPSEAIGFHAIVQLDDCMQLCS
jgi:hypothetical protein